MGKVFICYRREDSGGYVDYLYLELRNRFGGKNVFRDIEGLKRGDVFADVIAERLNEAVVMIVVIGKAWLTVGEDNGHRRLDDPEDFVRLEIATALRRNIRVIPVLVAGAQLPPVHALPMEIQGLLKHQSLTLHQETYERQTKQLLNDLSKLPRLWSRRLLWYLFSGVMVAAIIIALALTLPLSRPTKSSGGRFGRDELSKRPTSVIDQGILRISVVDRLTKRPADFAILTVRGDDPRLTWNGRTFQELAWHGQRLECNVPYGDYTLEVYYHGASKTERVTIAVPVTESVIQVP